MTQSVPAARVRTRTFPTLADERRRSTREPVEAKGLLSVGPLGEEGEGRLVSVTDVSLRGVGFHSNFALQPGDVHYILVMAGPLRLSSRLRIVSARATANGSYEVGAAFF